MSLKVLNDDIVYIVKFKKQNLKCEMNCIEDYIFS